MLEGLDNVPWDSFKQPEWNEPGAIPDAIRALASAQTLLDGGLLDAVGNNHCGSYYPVILQVFPFLEEILREGSPTAQECVLEVLLDLGSFGAELGHKFVSTPDGEKELDQLVENEIKKLTSLVQSRTKRTDTAWMDRAAWPVGPRVAGLAYDLLGDLDSSQRDALESELGRHSAVDQVCVLDNGVAFVVRKPNQSLTEKELVDWSRAAPGPLSFLRRVHFVKSLLTLQPGRVRNELLRQRLEDPTRPLDF